MTTTDTAIELTLAHRVRVQTDHRVWGLGCPAVCSCGWASHWELSGEYATRAATDHTHTAVGPPTDLDATLSGLLDLQDDLAEVVIWLADNWSAHLPTPHATTSCQYSDDGKAIPGVRLLVYADSSAVLARLAELLGAPAVADAEPDSRGSRYDRAIRHFGRVEIDAYRSLDDNEPAP